MYKRMVNAMVDGKHIWTYIHTSPYGYAIGVTRDGAEYSPIRYE